jgi:hypothetical protein
MVKDSEITTQRVLAMETRRTHSVVSIDFGDLMDPVCGIAKANSLSINQVVRLLVRKALEVSREDQALRIQIPNSVLPR